MEPLISVRHIQSLPVPPIHSEVAEAIYLFPGKPWQKEEGKKVLQPTNYSAVNLYGATREGGYKCLVSGIVCLLITLLSLIPIMLGAGLCSDSVTGMTAGLALIRNDHRPGYKTHTQTHARLRHLGLQSQQQRRLTCKPDCSRNLSLLATIRACHLWLHTFVSAKQEKRQLDRLRKRSGLKH